MSFSHLRCHLNVINDKMVGIGWFRSESVHASAARRVVQRGARAAATSTVIATKRYGVTAEVAASAQRDVANSSPQADSLRSGDDLNESSGYAVHHSSTMHLSG
jgi:hypothetical protein